jgi:hypothetical protein
LPSLAGKQRKKNTDVAHDGSCTAFYCKSCWTARYCPERYNEFDFFLEN